MMYLVASSYVEDSEVESRRFQCEAATPYGAVAAYLRRLASAEHPVRFNADDFWLEVSVPVPGGQPRVVLRVDDVAVLEEYSEAAIPRLRTRAVVEVWYEEEEETP